MKFCNLPHVIENELFNDIVSPSEVISLQRLVYVVAATLPKVSFYIQIKKF